MKGSLNFCARQNFLAKLAPLSSIIILLIVVSIFSVILIRLILKNLKKESQEDVEIKIRYRDVEGIDLFNFVPIIALVILYFIYHYIVF